MRNIKSLLFIAGLSVLAASCKKELEVKNPNLPTPASAATEIGIYNLAQGGTYLNGFKNTKYSSDQLLPQFWGETITYHSIMGDETWQEAANEYMNQLGAPFQVTLDNGTVVINPNAPQSQIALIRQVNQNSYGYANPLFYEWAYMYALNNAMNNVLSIVPNVSFSGDSTTKQATIKAWAYYWKGYAYSRIGSLYYAGVVNNAVNPTDLAGPSPTNGSYVSHQGMILAASKCFDTATALISAITDSSAFESVLGTVIPAIFQVGLGGAFTPSMLIRNINTMRARDILVNNNINNMTAAQWDSVLNYANNGIQQGDYVFTARSDNNSTFMSAGGNLAAETTGDPNNTASFQVMERLIQDFQPGDYRFNNNFSLSTTGVFTYPDRSEAGGTRWQLLDGNPNNGVTGDSAAVLYPDSTAKYANTVLYCNTGVGAYELYLAGTYEENELMKGEANIYLNNISTGLKSIDNVRNYQGANLAPLNSGLSLAAAKEQLRSERRIALMFRGIAFYDARRWGVIYSTANGGGRTGCWLIDANGNLNVNATIDYNYLDYWDVPGNESAYNAAGSGSVPIINPAN